MKQDFPLIGIGGMPRSGKDSLAELFIQAGYFGLSFGDVVRAFSRSRHADKPDPISVANMTETSNWLRETRGPDVILQEALNQYEEKKQRGELYMGLVLWSIRAPVEVDFILAHGGKLIWVEADDTVRHARGQRSLREGEALITLEEFKKQEALQWKPQPGIPAEVQMDISYVRDHATHTLVNNEDDLDLFLKKAHELINSLSD
jgi:dephospho-CoA kinase